MKSLLFTAILSLRKRSEQILIKFAILLQVRLTHAQTFFRGVVKSPAKTRAVFAHAQSIFQPLMKYRIFGQAVSKIHDSFGLCNVMTAFDPPFERLFYEDFNGGFRFKRE